MTGTSHGTIKVGIGGKIEKRSLESFQSTATENRQIWFRKEHPAPFFWIPVCLTVFSAIGLLRFYEENRIWYLYSPSGADSHYEHAVANEFFNDRGGKFWLEPYDDSRLDAAIPLVVSPVSQLMNHTRTQPASTSAKLAKLHQSPDSRLSAELTAAHPIDCRRPCVVTLRMCAEKKPTGWLAESLNEPYGFEKCVNAGFSVDLDVGKRTDVWESLWGHFRVTITARDMGNLLRRNYFDEVESLSNYLQYNFTSDCYLEGKAQCTFADLCSGSSCAENQVVPLFNLIYRNASSRLHPNFRLTFPTMHLYNDEYYVGEHFAGVEIDRNTNVWETSMFDYVEHFQHPILNVTCNSDALIAREVRKNGMTCVPYFTISVALVYCFILITNRREHFKLTHSVFMAFLGVAGPLMAVGTTFCLLFLMGFPFNSITLVMPFLIIGVGSDDVFIIIHAMRKTDKRTSLEDQIAETMEEAGPSITVTSVTNILSFGIGILTPTPAISIFCLYTCVGVAIDFVYQLTFFVAALVYEEIRIANPEKPPIEDVVKKKEIVSAKPSVRSVYPADPNGIVAKYCRVLKMWQTRLALLIVLIFYWIASLYGCQKMEIRMDTTNLVMKDSPLHNVAYVYENFLWKEGQLVLVFVNNPPDLSMEDNQRRMLGLVGEFENLPYSMGKNSTSFWLRSFLYQSALYHTKEGFYTLLDAWLQDSENGGARWNDMLRLKRNVNGMVVGVEKFMFATASAMGEEASWNTRAKLQHTWREVAKRNEQYNVTIFQTYSFYVDQLDSIGGNTLSTVIVAAITMDLACFLMIPSASSIISSSIAMLSINVGVFGLLSLWDVNLDPISMCTTLMSIGFSVDFTAHISYHYYRNPMSWTTDERLADALRSIGWPMIQAGCSTIFCISPLLLIDSYMVYVFAKTIYLVIGLGLLHGIVFLPALLLTIGCSAELDDKVSPIPNKLARTLEIAELGNTRQVQEVKRGSVAHALLYGHDSTDLFKDNNANLQEFRWHESVWSVAFGLK
ncbi:patched family protein [Ancylostoma ceylanicum]|uniref:Patched family protein n=1 Tax=Ancylostoma ceylanicum TaxID=53326 RepID=A0A0D6M732_9BILA|nr:patched family protein [Ancylostoma ceylanicum]